MGPGSRARIRPMSGKKTGGKRKYRAAFRPEIRREKCQTRVGIFGRKGGWTRMYGCVRTCGCWGCADECMDVFLRMFEGFFFSFSLVLLFFFPPGRACRRG